MKAKTNSMKLVQTEKMIFDAPSTYEFKLVNGVKIETVESFLKRGGTITYIGSFSRPDHITNTPMITTIAIPLKDAA